MLQAQSIPALHQTPSAAAAVDPVFTKWKTAVETHFNGETRSKKRIHELEQKQETAKLGIVNKNNEIKTIRATKSLQERSASV